MSPQPPFAKGDHLSRSVRGNSDRLGRRHKLLVGGQPTISCTPGKTVRDGKECGSRTQQLLLKKIAGIEPHNLRSKATCLTTKPFPLVLFLLHSISNIFFIFINDFECCWRALPESVVKRYTIAVQQFLCTSQTQYFCALVDECLSSSSICVTYSSCSLHIQLQQSNHVWEAKN